MTHNSHFFMFYLFEILRSLRALNFCFCYYEQAAFAWKPNAFCMTSLSLPGSVWSRFTRLWKRRNRSFLVCLYSPVGVASKGLNLHQDLDRPACKFSISCGAIQCKRALGYCTRCRSWKCTYQRTPSMSMCGPNDQQSTTLIRLISKSRDPIQYCSFSL